MLRLFVLALVWSWALPSVAAASASGRVVDNGPPYTSEQFMALSNERIPESFNATAARVVGARAGLSAQACAQLRRATCGGRSSCAITWASSPKAWPVGDAEKCEQDAYKVTQRGKSIVDRGRQMDRTVGRMPQARQAHAMGRVDLRLAVTRSAPRASGPAPPRGNRRRV